MKKFLLSVCSFALIFNQAFAQNHNQEFYLDKSHSQRTTGWILTSIGGAMIIGGSIAFAENFEIFGPGGESEAIIVGAGTVMAGIGVIQLIKASKNKIRAGVSINNYMKPTLNNGKMEFSKNALLNGTVCISLSKTKRTSLMSY